MVPVKKNNKICGNVSVVVCDTMEVIKFFEYYFEKKKKKKKNLSWFYDSSCAYSTSNFI